jgi:hypothetical protein
VNPLVVVQHHPSRADLLERLIPAIGDLPTWVVEDPGGDLPDPWRCYRACLEAAGHPWTHIVVLQDDAIACERFDAQLSRLLELEPDRVVVLWLAAQPARSAMDATRALRLKQPLSKLHHQDWLPAVGVAWPVELAADVLEWSDSRRRHSRSDDKMLGDWMRDRRQEVKVAVPSIVEHPDDVASLVGNGAGARGRNPSRVALHFPPHAMAHLTPSDVRTTLSAI